MTDAERDTSGTFAPLRYPVFRRVWSASLLSNLGHLMLGVGAAWEMARIAPSAQMVALVQTAMMLPLMLVSVPAGAVADMFDRRRIAMWGLAISMVSAAALTAITLAGFLTPWPLLGFCVLIGSGVALYSPSWQASISEQVPPPAVPGAIALGTISYNIGRSFGPAIGGAVLLAVGAQGLFALNMLLYAPLFVAFLLWQRIPIPSRLPPERMDRAIQSGARYAIHAPAVRNSLVRAAVVGFATAGTGALAPLIVRDLLGGNAALFGLLLGAGGVGAVLGALFVAPLRQRFTPERAIALCALVSAAGSATIALSSNAILSCVAMVAVGGANIIVIALLNVGVQLGAPRWVMGRALSLFSASLTGGIALGAWVWGEVADRGSLSASLLIAAAVLLASPLLGLLLPVKTASPGDVTEASIEGEPEVALAIDWRSGPVAIEIAYDVEPDRARAFHTVMAGMQDARHRRGAYGWTLQRDIADPSRWVERYHCPTWGDYLRMRSRFTETERALQLQADAFHRGPSGSDRVRRLLERPVGSVRWKADSPDSGPEPVGPLSP